MRDGQRDVRGPVVRQVYFLRNCQRLSVMLLPVLIEKRVEIVPAGVLRIELDGAFGMYPVMK